MRRVSTWFVVCRYFFGYFGNFFWNSNGKMQEFCVSLVESRDLITNHRLYVLLLHKQTVHTVFKTKILENLSFTEYYFTSLFETSSNLWIPCQKPPKTIYLYLLSTIILSITTLLSSFYFLIKTFNTQTNKIYSETRPLRCTIIAILKNVEPIRKKILMSYLSVAGLLVVCTCVCTTMLL